MASAKQPTAEQAPELAVDRAPPACFKIAMNAPVVSAVT
jgi:hypothetical protein